MGLTKREDGYYVEFRVLDDGKVLSLGSVSQGAKLKRWRVGCPNVTEAKKQEAIIKTNLLAGRIPSELLRHTSLTFGQTTLPQRMWRPSVRSEEKVGHSPQ